MRGRVAIYIKKILMLSLSKHELPARRIAR